MLYVSKLRQAAGIRICFLSNSTKHNQNLYNLYMSKISNIIKGQHFVSTYILNCFQLMTIK